VKNEDIIVQSNAFITQQNFKLQTNRLNILKEMVMKNE